MNTTELHDLFRVEMHDVAEPFLFQDAAIYAYINDAQVRFCRLTEGIEDARSFKVAIAPGVEWYPRDPMILKLRAARDAEGRTINVLNPERLDQNCVRFDGRTGPTKALVDGLEKNMLRAWQVPTDATTISLEVFRLPYPVEKGDEFEIDEQHHLALLMWVKHLAYGNHDVEVFDRRKSDDFELQFRRYCAEAKAEQARARRQVGAVQYGGY